MSQVKITWKAFGDKPAANKFVTSVEFETDFKLEDWYIEQFMNIAYRQTNTYSGNLWDVISPLLSPLRTHTALSIGDEIEIDGVAYVTANFGFIKVEDADIEIAEIDGRQIVMGVKEKVVA
jgi:hypothetical protein